MTLHEFWPWRDTHTHQRQAIKKMCVSKFIVVLGEGSLGAVFVSELGVGLFGRQRAYFSGNMVHVCNVVCPLVQPQACVSLRMVFPVLRPL